MIYFGKLQTFLKCKIRRRVECFQITHRIRRHWHSTDSNFSYPKGTFGACEVNVSNTYMYVNSIISNTINSQKLLKITGV